MPIVLVRVDNRFIHGQILEGWIPATRAEELFIANDAMAEDDEQKVIMETALTHPVELVIDKVERIASLLIQPESRPFRKIVLVAHPRDALRLKNAGVPFDQLILGNLGAQQEPVSLSDRVIVGKDAREALNSIMKAGVQVHVQGLPSEKPIDLCEFCDCVASG